MTSVQITEGSDDHADAREEGEGHPTTSFFLYGRSDGKILCVHFVCSFCIVQDDLFNLIYLITWNAVKPAVSRQPSFF